MEKLTKSDIVKNIIDDMDDELLDEEIIHLVLEKKISQKPQQKSSSTPGQKAADAFASFAGSWTFIIGFSVVLCTWIVINVILATRAFDSYPFILLNLVLSCIAAIQAPLIMMSQNRQEAKDRERAENDYKVNLKAEIIIQDLHAKLDQILENQQKNTAAADPRTPASPPSE
ncbi:DUF1003 domain-containing protein [Papillibacter cinnamivorans]|uniref:DUF1003 domain-containing protein n=1 Tax=Papillibacter cinnamivorans DSM 12816 TaxID=1122930 RepID=A0A1W2CKB1_9FIRM|nr:DUF1003 domain-containing protein [Papillibacter cinnamivorans]SMC85621.1 Protein of unknown function [Papillibacter cinnamivorans DSM 12816]